MSEQTHHRRKRVSLVIPMYNEGDALEVLFARLDVVLPTIDHYEFEIVCVNDGSTDQTLSALEQASASRSNLVVVDLSRNFGKEAALSAGLFMSTGDAVIPMDADLQDPPEVIRDLLANWEEGFEVVLARRATSRIVPVALLETTLIDLSARPAAGPTIPIEETRTS